MIIKEFKPSGDGPPSKRDYLEQIEESSIAAFLATGDTGRGAKRPGVELEARQGGRFSRFHELPVSSSMVQRTSI